MGFELLFNSHRKLALLVILIADICVWYAWILMTNSATKPISINKNQWIGLGFAILVALLLWFNQCFTIIPYKKSD